MLNTNIEMKLSNVLLLPALTLTTAVSAGPATFALGSGGCLVACGSAFASCHAAAHSASIFTLGVSSWLAFAGCHQVFLTCEANCMYAVSVGSVTTPI
jgi:hypothetical protein